MLMGSPLLLLLFMRPGCDLAAQRPFPKWETGRPVTVEGIFLPTPETQSFVPTSTDVAEGRDFFEQPFSVLGHPGPCFYQNLESMDGRRNRDN